MRCVEAGESGPIFFCPVESSAPWLPPLNKVPWENRVKISISIGFQVLLRYIYFHVSRAVRVEHKSPPGVVSFSVGEAMLLAEPLQTSSALCSAGSATQHNYRQGVVGRYSVV